MRLAAWRGALPLLCQLAACALLAATFASTAAAQGTSEFTLSATSINPDAVAPSGVADLPIIVGLPTPSSPGVSVNLSCQVTGQQAATSPPVCSISPNPVTSPETANATITTQSTTTTQAYNITITGTGPTTTFTTPAIPLTVLAVTPQFTITVTGAVAPTSVPAGNGAQATVTVNPLYGYVTPNGGGITLSCASMTPLVTIPPTCSFSYPNGGSSLQVNGTNSATATLNINTFGPVTTGAHNWNKGLRLWLALPIFGLVGFGAAAGKRAKAAAVTMMLLMVCGVFLLTPACGNSTNTSTTTPNGVTPANTYTFTIVGVDSNGVVSSNTTSSGTTSSGPSVSLTVTTPPKP